MERSWAEVDDGSWGVELGVGVVGGVGEEEQDNSKDGGVGTGEVGGLMVEGEEQVTLKEWLGGGKAMAGKYLSVVVLLSDPEESESLWRFEDGGGGRRGT